VGVIMHYDGAEWSPMNSGTRMLLTSVWGSSADDVYAVGLDGGHGIILHGRR
jgi:hypothetical protein